jgi:hypothetical protein
VGLAGNNQTNVSDEQNIDKLMGLFYSIFSNANEKQPAWAIMNTVCIAEIIIIKKEMFKQSIYDLNSFVEPRKKILSDGTLTDFEEHEISGDTKVIGNIAQRSSRYQKSGYLNGKYFKEYGNKFFQLIKTAGGWKINAIIWEDDVV